MTMRWITLQNTELPPTIWHGQRLTPSITFSHSFYRKTQQKSREIVEQDILQQIATRLLFHRLDLELMGNILVGDIGTPFFWWAVVGCAVSQEGVKQLDLPTSASVPVPSNGSSNVYPTSDRYHEPQAFG